MTRLAGWFVELDVPMAAVPDFSAVFDGIAATVAMVEVEPDRVWRIEAFLRAAPDRAALAVAVELAATAGGWPAPELRIRPEPVSDWVAATYRRFPPRRIGRFFVHGGHWLGSPPAGAVPLRIEAALAFGSGEHGSTSGCLMAMSTLARRLRRPRVLDLGCGSGILAIAAAKLWRMRVLASDNDPVAVRTALGNARINGVGGRVRGVVSAGFASPRLSGPFDLVLANILARPLMRLARPLALRLAPGGHAVLSGLLADQARLVLQAYRRQGLALDRRFRQGDWTTLVLIRKAAAG